MLRGVRLLGKGPGATLCHCRTRIVGLQRFDNVERDFVKLTCVGKSEGLIVTSDHAVMARRCATPEASHAEESRHLWHPWPAQELRTCTHEVVMVDGPSGCRQRHASLSAVDRIFRRQEAVVQIELEQEDDAILVSGGVGISNEDSFVAVYGEPRQDVDWAMLCRFGRGLNLQPPLQRQALARSYSDSLLPFLGAQSQFAVGTPARTAAHLQCVDASSSEGMSATVTSEPETASSSPAVVRVGGPVPLQKDTAPSEGCETIICSASVDACHRKHQERRVWLSSVLELPRDTLGRRLNSRSLEGHSAACGTVCWFHRPPKSCLKGVLCDWCHHEEHWAAPLAARRGNRRSRGKTALA